MSNKSRGQRAETALRAILQARGYLVIRSAASKVYDLVCVDEGGFVFFLEVKSVKGNCFRVSRTAMTREQHAQMRRDMMRYGNPEGVHFAYCIRFPDGEYRIYGAEREIMPQHEGISLDVCFPLRNTPNKPPIVPQTYAPSLPTGFEPMNSTSDALDTDEAQYRVECIRDDRDGQGGGTD